MFQSLQSIPTFGPKTILKLNRLGIFTPKDLLYHFPTRYLDFSKNSTIESLLQNEPATIRGQLISLNNIYTRSRKNILKAIVADTTGKIELIWFNQPYLEKNFTVGQTYSFAGVPTLYQNRLTLISPEYSSLRTGKIIPIYPQTSGLNSKWFQKIFSLHLNNLLTDIPESLPPKIIQQFKLVPLKTALLQIHQPGSLRSLESARYRLSLEEILSYQIKSHLSRQKWLSLSPPFTLKTTPTIDKKTTNLIKNLPFSLTSSQKIAWKEIKTDLLSASKIQNRLLQGDVGSGKTILAILAAYFTHLNQKSSLILAPTEILAQQHYLTFKKFLPPSTPLHLLTANSQPDFSQIKPSSIIIATHAAIFQKKFLPYPITFLVIDEQHKFGVKQRNFLSESQPHTLTMTATPIPRTVNLTFLGNLDLSYLDTAPKNRLPIKTFVVPPQKQSACYQWIKDQINTHQSQVFIVCPLIEESETLLDVKSVKKEFEHLKTIFSEYKLALIHGKIKSKDREKIIDRFTHHLTDILVSTPIIEVGIDIAQAAIIIIQSADRFGLAQLHQLRGRVGRRGQQGYCYLFSENQNQKAINRLNYLQTHHSGQKIAEFDLKTRGPGEVFSTIQHGFPSLKLASLSDSELITTSAKLLSQLISKFPRHLQNISKNNQPDPDSHQA
jgi:ATP-dependent DNA helicase RecG